MERRHLLLAVALAFAVLGATASHWVLSRQEVTVQVYYGWDTTGKTVAISIDGGTVGSFVVPSNSTCSMAMNPCGETLADVWLAKGPHAVHVTINGTPTLDNEFTVTGRAYVWFEIYWNDRTDFGMGSGPPVFA